MVTVFTRIINGELPGHHVWRDEHCVAFLSINPMAPGHTLVVPIQEIDHWIDAPDALSAHLFEVTRIIGIAQQNAYECERIGVIIAGYEVPHTHIHVIPTTTIAQISFTNAAANADPGELALNAERIRSALRSLGRTEVTA